MRPIISYVLRVIILGILVSTVFPEVLSLYFLEESSRNDTLCIYMSGHDFTKGYGYRKKGPRRILDFIGYPEECWISSVSNLEFIALSICLEIPTQQSRFSVLCDGISDSSTL